jgi:hypothetical protein
MTGRPTDYPPFLTAAHSLLLSLTILVGKCALRPSPAGKPTISQACRQLATQRDYEEYCKSYVGDPKDLLPADAYRLEPSEGLSRADHYDDGVVFMSEHFCASPGAVVAANSSVVEHSCSALPQMCGGPCKAQHALNAAT